MLSRIPAFFYIIFTISFFAHLFVYFSFVRFFSVAHFKARAILLVVTVLLSFSFVASAMIVRAWGGLFSEYLYLVSALWMGFLIYLLFAFALGWAVLLSGWVAGLAPNMAAVGGLLILAAFSYSSYGVWSAFHPRVKTVEVVIKDLPPEWEKRTIVQISDVHLGNIYGPGFFRDVVRKVNSLDPDLVLITGDLFDGMSGEISSFKEPLNEIRAKRGVFFITGNHEIYLGIDRVLPLLDKTGIRVLDNDVVNIDGLRIIGVSYPMAGEKRDIKKIIRSRKDFKGRMPTVLMYHQPASIDRTNSDIAEQQRRTYFSPVIDFTAARELGADLQLSGHTHRGQMFPFGYLTRRFYKGYDYGLRSDVGFSIYTTCGVGTWGPPMRTDTTPEIVAIRLKRGH